MSSNVFLLAFLNHVDDLLNQLCLMFPNDGDFKTFKMFLGMLRKTNPVLILSSFHEHVTQKYESQIDNKDESFLLSYIPVEHGQDITDIIIKLRPYWTDISANSKDSLWKYFYTLKELTKRYYKS